MCADATARSRAGVLRVAEADWASLVAHLLGSGAEEAAALLCGTDGQDALVVSEVIALSDEDYLNRGDLHLSIDPVFLARAAKRARTLGMTLVLAHSHPFAGRVLASALDLATERDLCGRVIFARTERPVGALVLGPDGFDGRLWSGNDVMELERITLVGECVQHLTGSSGGDASPGSDVDLEDRYARHASIWGSEGQQLLRKSSVAIVGLGGTGSHVAQQLGHLGIGHLTLLDDDAIDDSNLSRVVGSTVGDVGTAKVEVARRLVASINPEARVECLQLNVLDEALEHLRGCDVIVCATDSHGSRDLLNRVAKQYLVPVVDLGVEVTRGDDAAARAGGGVRVLRPGSGCLLCSGSLVPEMIRRDYLSDAARSEEVRRGYIDGVPESSPSVIALNGVVASLAVLEVCHLLVGLLAGGPDRLLYRAAQRRLSTAALPRNDDCWVCGTNGLAGKGDSVALPKRAVDPE